MNVGFTAKTGSDLRNSPLAWKTLFTDRGEWLRDTNAMLVSASCHFSMLIMIALISVVSAGGGGGDNLVVNLGQGGDGGPSTIPDPAPLQGDAKASQHSPLAADEQLDAVLAPTAAMNPAPLFSTDGLAASTKLDIGPLALPTSTSAGSGPLGDLAASGDFGTPSGLGGDGRGGGRKGEGSSGKVSTDFFGIEGYGESFVYVVDCSGSMNQNGKFERARYELLQSIEQLNKNQSYFVIFYNHSAHPMEGGKLVFATPAHIAETTRWINYADADGGTNPLPALLYALSLHRDQIYFLSDGQFDPNTIQEIRLQNRPNNRMKIRQVPIHTIAFYDKFAAGLMRQIARNSGGQFKFVQ